MGTLGHETLNVSLESMDTEECQRYRRGKFARLPRRELSCAERGIAASRL